jgi:hypothetical protein
VAPQTPHQVVVGKPPPYVIPTAPPPEPKAIAPHTPKRLLRMFGTTEPLIGKIKNHEPPANLLAVFGAEELVKEFAVQNVSLDIFRSSGYTMLELSRMFSYEELKALGLCKDHLKDKWSLRVLCIAYESLDWLTVGMQLSMRINEMINSGITDAMLQQKSFDTETWRRFGLGIDVFLELKYTFEKAKSTFSMHTIQDFSAFKLSAREIAKIQEKCPSESWSRECFVRAFPDVTEEQLDALGFVQAVEQPRRFSNWMPFSKQQPGPIPAVGKQQPSAMIPPSQPKTQPKAPQSSRVILSSWD